MEDLSLPKGSYIIHSGYVNGCRSSRTVWTTSNVPKVFSNIRLLGGPVPIVAYATLLSIVDMTTVTSQFLKKQEKRYYN